MAFDSIIIGAGISGLTVAYYLKQAGCNVLLLESSARAGGVIQSFEVDGFRLERGPNSLRGTHEFLDLVDDLKLNDQLLTANPKAPAYVYFQRTLHPVPMSPPALIGTKLLSARAKFRLLREPFIAGRRETGEESLSSFVRRRLGDEILERLVAPFVSGVYAGDPKRLSVQASFVRLAELEASAGSLFKGAIKAARAAKADKNKPARSLRPYRLCSFRDGLQVLPQSLAKALGAQLWTESSVRTITRNANSSYEIVVERTGERTTLETAALIMATPAYAAASLLQQVAPELSSLLSEVPYTAIAAVPLAYRRTQVGHAFDGFGFLAPRQQGLRTLGSIWNSALFPQRAPDGFVLTNNFIGGETDREAIQLSDEDLTRIVHQDLQTALGIQGEPHRLPITRWQRAIPQYNLGHAARVAAIEAMLQQHPGLQIAGNYLHGIALGDCIKRGKDLALEVKQWLSSH